MNEAKVLKAAKALRATVEREFNGLWLVQRGQNVQYNAAMTALDAALKEKTRT
jgi:hypothetical protein